MTSHSEAATTWQEHKIANAADAPFPVENAATTLAFYPHHTTSNYKAYVYGGTGRFGTYASATDLYEFNVTTASTSVFILPSWRKIQTKPAQGDWDNVPEPRVYHTLTFVPAVNKLILFGGESGPSWGKVNDNKIYELILDDFKFEWDLPVTASESIVETTGKALKPLARCKHAAVASSTEPYLYVFGGYSTLLNADFGDLWRFDAVNNTWKLLGLSGFSQAAKKGTTSAPATTTAKEEKAAASASSSSASSSSAAPEAPKKQIAAPAPRSGHLMTISPKNDKLYIIGGCNKDGVPFKDIWEFDLTTSSWAQLSYEVQETSVPVTPQETKAAPAEAPVSPAAATATSPGTTTKPTTEGDFLSGGILEAPFNEIRKQTIIRRAKTVISSPAFYIPGRGGAAVMFGNCIIIAGGETLMTAAEGAAPVLSDVLMYHVPTRKLIKCGVENPLAAVTNHGIIMVHDQLYLIGGKTSWPYFNHVLTLNVFKHEKILKNLIDPADKVLGIPLEKLRLTTDSRKIPVFVAVMLDYLNEKGVDAEGIFRLSPGSSEFHGLQLKFEEGTDIESIDLTYQKNPHTVSCLLKTFLRELPEPLLTTALANDFMNPFKQNINMDAPTAIKTLNAILPKVPALNKRILKELLKLLNKISQRSELNLMNASNLAISFGPSYILSPKVHNTAEDLELLQPIVKLMTMMIENHDKLKFD